MEKQRHTANRRALLKATGALGIVAFGTSSSRGRVSLDSRARSQLAPNGESAIVIGADGVTLDGEGRTLTGEENTDATAVFVTGDDVTVKNLVLDGWNHAVHFQGTTGGLVTNVTATGQPDDGGQLVCEDATGTTITECTLRGLTSVRLVDVEDVTIRSTRGGRGGDGTAIFASGARGCRVLDNDFSRSDSGIHAQDAHGWEIRRNDLNGNIGPLSLTGDGNVVEENTAVDCEDGFRITGNDNRIVRNTICTAVDTEGDDAVSVSGTGNVVRENRGCSTAHYEVVARDGAPVFEYRFVADDVAFGGTAENNDRIVRNDDGTVTVLGRVGNGFRDDFDVDGFRGFSTNTGVGDVAVLRDGVDVTDDVTGPESLLEVRSVGNEERFSYEITLHGAAEMVTDAGRNSAERNDRIAVTEDGLVIRGVVGGGYGDTFRTWNGGAVDFEATTSPDNYEIRTS